MTRPILGCSLLILVVASACGRTAPPPAMPLPLVNALMNADMSRSAPRYSIGTVPDEFPASLRPGGTAKPVGGMAMGNQVTAIFADSSRPIVPVFEALLAQAGYRRPPTRAGEGFSGGSRGTNTFCGDSGFVYILPVAREPNLLRVTYSHSRGMDCDDERRPIQPSLVLPELKPPPGVRVARSGGGHSSDNVDSHAEMTGTNLVPRDILAHYANQLTAAGWKADPPAISDRVAAQFFEARSAAGQTWSGTLTVVGSGSSLSLELSMRPK